MGYHVHGFTDSEKALKTFKKLKDHIHIVISDIVMPVIPGHKLASEMLSIKPDLPIILITGYNDFVDINEVNKIGVKEVLYKPVMIEELAMAISEILNEE